MICWSRRPRPVGTCEGKQLVTDVEATRLAGPAPGADWDSRERSERGFKLLERKKRRACTVRGPVDRLEERDLEEEAGKGFALSLPPLAAFVEATPDRRVVALCLGGPEIDALILDVEDDLAVLRSGPLRKAAGSGRSARATQRPAHRSHGAPAEPGSPIRGGLVSAPAESAPLAGLRAYGTARCARRDGNSRERGGWSRHSDLNRGPAVYELDRPERCGTSVESRA